MTSRTTDWLTVGNMTSSGLFDCCWMFLALPGALTVSRSMSSTFIPGPLFSIIFEMYCFTASVTFMMVTQWEQNKQQQRHYENKTTKPAESDFQRLQYDSGLNCCDNTAAAELPGLWRHSMFAQRVRVTSWSTYFDKVEWQINLKKIMLVEATQNIILH